jgi:hypothetical protein
VSSAVIVGAGVFGASLAWRLTAEGWAVTLVDRLEPGHVRASSGGESRLIRLGHAGEERWYRRSAARALGLWEEVGRESGVEVLVRAGIAWFARHGDELVARCEAGLREDGIAVERLEPAAAARMFPDLATEDLAYVLHEPTSGIVRARPIGMMVMEDEGEGDEKIICVHLDDPEYNSYTHHSELPAHRLNELRRFFEDYKVLEGKKVKVGDFLDPDDAKQTVSEAMRLYDETFAGDKAATADSRDV